MPFSRLWGQMPPPPVAGGEDAAATDVVGAASVALIFGVPSLVPFVLLARLRWPAVNAAVSSRWLTRGLVGLILLPGLVSLATYPCCTSDVLDYVNRQRLWVVYGDNPFTLVPNDHPEDWSYYFANFKDLPFSYGPGWWWIARLATSWATTLDEYLLGFKVLAAICFAASAALIWRLADERLRLVSLAFFAWNPAVLVEGLVRLQNDLLTVPCVLLAVWLWRRQRLSSSLIVAAAAGLVKVTVAPIGLVLAASLLRRHQWRSLGVALLGAALVAAALIGAVGRGVVGVEALAGLVAQANRPQWSLGSMLLLAGLSAPLVRVLLGLACLGLVARCLARLPIGEGFADTSVLVMLVGLLLLPMAFYSHYLMPAVGLAAVAADGRLRTLVLAIGFGAMVNAVLGVDTFAGGPSGAMLDVTGSVVLILAVLVGLRVAARTAPRPAIAS